MKKFTSWSYSRYADYDQCPYKAKLKHLDKIEEPPSPAMKRGIFIHKLAERAVNSDEHPIPAELKKHATLIRRLRAARKSDPQKVIVEQMWGFDDAWRPCRWDDWDRCALRMKTDVTLLLRTSSVEIIDWKTGKMRPDQIDKYAQQMSLFALGAMKMFPERKKFTTRLAFLDAPEPNTFVSSDFDRSEHDEIMEVWGRRVEPMLNDEEFAPKANQFCAWCHYRNGNGGPCAL